MGSNGYSRRVSLGVCSLALIWAIPSAAALRSDIAVPAGPLATVLTELARQSGAEMVSGEAGLTTVVVPGVKGRLTAEAALGKLLAGTGFRAVRLGPGSFRVERVPPPPHVQAATVAPPVRSAPEDIIVQASKHPVRQLRFPGSILVIDPDRLPGGRAADLDDVARTQPVLQSTALGNGRNKIFVRGIADSSFNGATQSTTGVYFGDVALGYSGVEPALVTYDIERIEIMEGPQGTLYGSGSIGGIVRLTPAVPDASHIAATGTAGIGTTTKGSISDEVRAMVNVPLIDGKLALRAVAYQDRDSGYIDDPRRKLSNINRSETYGGRLALRATPGGGWTIDVSGLGQRIDTAEGQYAEGSPLARKTFAAQPFFSSVLLGRAIITKDWASGLQLTSATGYVERRSDDVFDATASQLSAGEAEYDDARAGRLFTQELRLSRTLASGTSWLIGASYLDDQEVENRTFGPAANPVDIIGVANRTTNTSIFGEATLPFGRLAITVGARITSARTDGEPSARPSAVKFVRGRSTRRADPTLAFSWAVGDSWALYGRLQTGYRTGGIAVARGVGRVADYLSDEIRMGEIGIRHERHGATGLTAAAAVSYARWTAIQADLLDRRGQPYTANIGDADIVAVEASAEWVPVRRLVLSASALYTSNSITGPLLLTSVKGNRRLPETPPLSAIASAGYRWPGAGGEWHAGANIQYVGRSVLGPGDLLDLSQGNYAVAGLDAGWRRGRFGVRLRIDNLTDARANRFAFGNPFEFARRAETVPLQPLNAQLAFDVAW